jgi:hypothetical protein
VWLSCGECRECGKWLEYGISEETGTDNIAKTYEEEAMMIKRH